MIQEAKNTNKTAKKLAEIDNICFEKDYWTVKEWISEFSETVEIYFIRENVAKHIIGYSAWNINKISGIAYLISIAILPEYRKQGCAKKLIQYNIEDFTRLGIKLLFAHTRWANYTSQKLLKSIGFKINSIVTHYYEDEDAIEWKYDK